MKMQHFPIGLVTLLMRMVLSKNLSKKLFQQITQTNFSNFYKHFVFVFIVISAASNSFAENPVILHEPLHELRNQGFNELMNMRYPEAKSNFDAMIKADPNHPAGYIYLGQATWLNYLADLRRLQTNVYNKNNAFFDTKKEEKADPKVDSEFRKNMHKGVQLAESRLKQNPRDLQTMYFLGVAKNILAGYEATVNRSFFSALRNGSKGVNLHKAVIKKNSAFVDAYLSVGMYDYIVGSLPFAVKLLALIGGVHGSKKNGLAAVERVYRDGEYARDEAGTLLAMLYDREKRPNDALKVLNDLHERYPDNSLFALERAMKLAHLQRFAQSQEAFDAILQNPKAMNRIPDMIHYQYGEALFAAGDWDTAALHYAEAARSPKAPAAVKTLALLNEGRCFDAIGKRATALNRYDAVLKRPDVFRSHKMAKSFRKTPFKP